MLPHSFSRIVAAIILGFAASSIVGLLGAAGRAEGPSPQQRDVCARPEPGSAVPEPQDVRSRNGVLDIDLELR